MGDDKDDFGVTTAVSVDGGPIEWGEISGISVSTPSGRHLFDIGAKPDPQIDGIRDWRDQALLRILAELTARRSADHAHKTDEGISDIAADEWMETDQAAEYLKLTCKTVREGAVKGTLPGHKYPANSRRGRWRFKKMELDDFLNRKPRHYSTKGVTAW